MNRGKTVHSADREGRTGQAAPTVDPGIILHDRPHKTGFSQASMILRVGKPPVQGPDSLAFRWSVGEQPFHLPVIAGQIAADLARMTTETPKKGVDRDEVITSGETAPKLEVARRAQRSVQPAPRLRPQGCGPEAAFLLHERQMATVMQSGRQTPPRIPDGVLHPDKTAGAVDVSRPTTKPTDRAIGPQDVSHRGQSGRRQTVTGVDPPHPIILLRPGGLETALDGVVKTSVGHAFPRQLNPSCGTGGQTAARERSIPGPQPVHRSIR